jgi:hypothetical protein
MKALLINCTLKASPEAVDHSIPPGVESEMGEGDEWPGMTVGQGARKHHELVEEVEEYHRIESRR